MRALILLIALLVACPALAESERSKYLVFIGKKIDLTKVPPEPDRIPFDSQFLARYEILELYRGSYEGDQIEFTVFDHYGVPPFSKYEHVLLYLEKHDGHFYHAKYMYSPLYKTKDGRWAGPYDSYDYTHPNNESTTIKPEKIDFIDVVTIDVSEYEKDYIDRYFPAPYYEIQENKAVAIYGNYLDELFKLKQDGVLKARGDFQNID